MVRVAIIGRGWGERSQKPNWTEAGLEVGIIAGRDNWRDAIRSDADVVSVVMPPALHLEMAMAALDAGKHVICEKPMAMNAGEARTLVEAAAARPAQIAIIDHELRFLPALRAARERIGEIGPVRFAEVRYSSPSRGDRSRPWNWWSDASMGGGVWGAAGSHFVDALRFLGLDIEEARGELRTTIEERSGKRVTADDLAAVHLRLRGGAFAAMTFNAAGSGSDERAVLTLHGESGAFRFIGEELLFAKRGDEFRRVEGNDIVTRPGNSMGGAFGTGTYELGLALKRAIDGGDRSALAPAASFADGLEVQRVLDAVRRSSDSGGSWQSLA
jgi:predicted dehydrogenase